MNDCKHLRGINKNVTTKNCNACAIEYFEKVFVACSAQPESTQNANTKPSSNCDRSFQNELYIKEYTPGL